MSLARIARNFQDHVLSAAGGEANPAITAACGDGIESQVAGTARFPVATRLAIYADGYRARLEEALQTQYSELAKLLGPEPFHALAGHYIACHRSTHFSIRWYGDGLARFLAAQSPYRHRTLLAELASWEWTMGLVFDAADAPLFTREALAAVSPQAWGELRFGAHPSVRLLALHTNAAQVWKALSRDEEPPADQREDTAFPNWILWRQGLDTFFRPLDALESSAVQAVLRGECFAAICDELARRAGEEKAPVQAAAYLARWLQDGLLIEASPFQ